MLNKNTLNVKKVQGQSEAALQIGMCDLISVEAKNDIIIIIIYLLSMQSALLICSGFSQSYIQLQ